MLRMGLGKTCLRRHSYAMGDLREPSSGVLPDGGEGGIRTLEGLAPLTVFETARFSRSRTSPPLRIHDLAVLVQEGCDPGCDPLSLDSRRFGHNMRFRR